MCFGFVFVVFLVLLLVMVGVGVMLVKLINYYVEYYFENILLLLCVIYQIDGVIFDVCRFEQQYILIDDDKLKKEISVQVVKVCDIVC